MPVPLSDAARRHPQATRRLTTGHAALVRATRGRLAARWFGAPILLLETIGRRTGLPRTTPLVYLPDGDDIIVVAANAGADRAPAWWLNLTTAGEGVAVLGADRRPVAPTIVCGGRRDRLWRRFAAVSPVEHYQRRTARPLPVVALAPLHVPAPRVALATPGADPPRSYRHTIPTGNPGGISGSHDAGR